MKVLSATISAWFEPGEGLRTGQSCDDGGALFVGAENEWRRLPAEGTKRGAE